MIPPKKSPILVTPLLSLCLLALASPVRSQELNVDPKLARVAASCKPSSHKSSVVYFFKQWHLAPGVDAKTNRKPHPQSRNLESIYLQLEKWVKAGKISTLLTEGCSGTLDEKSSFQVNGWSLQDLAREKSKPGYSRIETSVPLKLKAKFGSRLQTLCGDNEALIREQLLGFSDARADVGYLTRIQEYQNDPAKLKPYLEDVIGQLKLPGDSDATRVRNALRSDLKKTVQGIRATLEKRNQSLIDRLLDAIAEGGPGPIALVYGGMHADGVKKLLEERGMNCKILEPIGYQNDEDLILMKLEEALEKP